MLGLIRNMLFLIPASFLLEAWLVPFVYEVWQLCFGIFKVWSKLAPEFIPKVKTIGPGVPQGRPPSVQAVPPQRVSCYPGKVLSKWVQSGTPFLIVGCIFQCLFASFLGRIPNIFSDGFGSNLASLLWFVLICVGCRFKSSRFVCMSIAPSREHRFQGLGISLSYAILFSHHNVKGILNSWPWPCLSSLLDVLFKTLDDAWQMLV